MVQRWKADVLISKPSQSLIHVFYIPVFGRGYRVSWKSFRYKKINTMSMEWWSGELDWLSSRIFDEIKHFLATGENLATPGLEAGRIAVAKKNTWDFSVELERRETGILEMRNTTPIISEACRIFKQYRSEWSLVGNLRARMRSPQSSGRCIRGSTFFNNPWNKSQELNVIPYSYSPADSKRKKLILWIQINLIVI